MMKKLRAMLMLLTLTCILLFALSAQALEKTPERLSGEIYCGYGTPLYIEAGTDSGKTVIYYMNSSEKV